jgi:hypothetical protein
MRFKEPRSEFLMAFLIGGAAVYYSRIAFFSVFVIARLRLRIAGAEEETDSINIRYGRRKWWL